MEREVLRVLDFDLTQPTIKTFLRRYIKAASGAPLGRQPYCGWVGCKWCPCMHAQAHHLQTLTSPGSAPARCSLPPWLFLPAAHPGSQPQPHAHPGPPLPFCPGEIPLDVTFEFLCSYLAELTLMDYGMLNYLPSMVAAACVAVALVMLGKPHWTATLSHYSGYLPRDLRHCAQVRTLAGRWPVPSEL